MNVEAPLMDLMAMAPPLGSPLNSPPVDAMDVETEEAEEAIPTFTVKMAVLQERDPAALAPIEPAQTQTSSQPASPKSEITEMQDPPFSFAQCELPDLDDCGAHVQVQTQAEPDTIPQLARALPQDTLPAIAQGAAGVPVPPNTFGHLGAAPGAHRTWCTNHPSIRRPQGAALLEAPVKLPGASNAQGEGATDTEGAQFQHATQSHHEEEPQASAEEERRFRGDASLGKEETQAPDTQEQPQTSTPAEESELEQASHTAAKAEQRMLAEAPPSEANSEPEHQSESLSLCTEPEQQIEDPHEPHEPATGPPEQEATAQAQEPPRPPPGKAPEPEPIPAPPHRELPQKDITFQTMQQDCREWLIGALEIRGMPRDHIATCLEVSCQLLEHVEDKVRQAEIECTESARKQGHYRGFQEGKRAHSGSRFALDSPPADTTQGDVQMPPDGAKAERWHMGAEDVTSLITNHGGSEADVSTVTHDERDYAVRAAAFESGLRISVHRALDAMPTTFIPGMEAFSRSLCTMEEKLTHMLDSNSHESEECFPLSPHSMWHIRTPSFFAHYVQPDHQPTVTPEHMAWLLNVAHQTSLFIPGPGRDAWTLTTQLRHGNDDLARDLQNFQKYYSLQLQAKKDALRVESLLYRHICRAQHGRLPLRQDAHLFHLFRYVTPLPGHPLPPVRNLPTGKLLVWYPLGQDN